MPKFNNPNLSRVSKTEFETKWSYCTPVDSNTQSIAWQYHTNVKDVKSGNEYVGQNAPPNQVIGTPVDQTGVGPNDVIAPGWYWPNRYPQLNMSRNPNGNPACTGKYLRVIATLNDMYFHYNGANHDQGIAMFKWSVPLPPIINPTRTQNALSWEIDSQDSKMGKDTNMNRSRTRWYVQRVSGTKYPNIDQYDTSSFGTTASGTWHTTPNGFKGATGNATATIRFEEQSTSPDRPYAIRIVAVNDGFTGASPFAVNEHVFAKPNTPTVSQRWSNDSEVSFNVKSNYEFWHPVEELRLERQTGSRCNPSGQWTPVAEYTDRNGIKELWNINDSQPGRIPVTDNATWYRVVSIHDEDNNTAASAVLPSSYIAKPTAPTISSCTWQSDHTVQMSVTKNSNMEVETYVAVKNISKDLPEDDVPAYKVEGELSSFLIQKNGQAKHFDINSVYEISVYNKVVNTSDLAAPYAVYGDMTRELPSSNAAVTQVRGSTGAIAKASLGEITIESVETNPSGKGITLAWSATPDKLNITYDDVGTFIEWTDADGGWISTEAPKSHKHSDGGNEFVEDGEGSGSNYGVVSIDGLTEGTTYQIRLRRYVTLDNEDGYGKETTTVAVPWSTPNKPTLNAPSYVLPGESVRYLWTFTDEGDTPQSAAQLTVNDIPYAVEGSVGSFILDVPDSLEGETLTASVRVAANGAFSDPSDEVVTTVAARPTCTVELVGTDDTQGYGGHTLTALPLQVDVGGSGDQWRVRVMANGAMVSPDPGGGKELVAGEVAATETFTAEGVGTIDGSMIIGGGNYDLECVCVDPTTGMESEPVLLGFTVDWETRAVLPSGTVQIVNGEAHIVPSQGEDADEGESCRIWRKVADGYVLACENALWDTDHLDRVPAYGSDELAYVIEAIGINGDHVWVEVPYELSGQDVRVTYGSDTVVLPWNLTPKSSYSKTFERRAHMDGHRAGFWEPGANQDWTSNSEIEKSDRALADSLRDLGRYDRLCYVRAPFGVAFAANINLDVSDSYNRGFTSVSMTCAEVEDDGSYAIVVTPHEEEGA